MLHNSVTRSDATPRRRRSDTVRAPRFGKSSRSNNQPPRSGTDRTLWLLVAGLTVLIIGWAALGLILERPRLGVVAPNAVIGFEATVVLTRFFSALVLFLFPHGQTGRSLRWVAAGFMILGLGGLLFGYLPLLLDRSTNLNTLQYTLLAVSLVAGGLFVEGLLFRTPPPFTRGKLIILFVVFNLLLIGVLLGVDNLPPLVNVSSPETAIHGGLLPTPALTAWHFSLSMLPLSLSVASAIGAVHLYRMEQRRIWLVVAMILLAGSQLHNILWPSIYTPVLTSAHLLRLASAVVVAVGGIVELRRIANEHAVLLAAEQEHTKRLVEIAALKADFTAMIAHEIVQPLAAIRGLTDMLATNQLTSTQQSQALATIHKEADMLTTLVSDVQTVATIERDDFAVRRRAVPLRPLLPDAATFAQALPGNHPLTITVDTDEIVYADPERISQVLRNLLNNAAKYSAPGTPIQVHATRGVKHVRIEVIDRGSGIHPDDLRRIFEKFERGHNQVTRSISGLGLGLYLSQRILQAHGTQLEVTSKVDVGSIFAFELEIKS